MGQIEYVGMWVGAKIREARKNNDLKLNELSQRTGISIAMLSKIENGRISPTLPSLLQIIDALDLRLSSFFTDLPENPNFSGYLHIKKSECQPIVKEEEAKGYAYELVFNRTLERSAMEVSVLTLRPGATRDKVTTDGLQLIYVVKGSIDYFLEDEALTLHEGDTLFFDGRKPHVPKNNTNNDAFLLVMYFLHIN